MIYQNFYVTIPTAKTMQDANLKSKVEKGDKFLVVSEDENGIIWIIDDNKNFTPIHKHLCLFAGFMTEEPVEIKDTDVIDDIIKRLDNIEIKLLANELAEETDKNAKHELPEPVKEPAKKGKTR